MAIEYLFAQAEAEREMCSLLRLGTVLEVDHAEALARMEVDGLETDWLPWAVARAGAVRIGSAPSEGEQRLIFAPFGDLAQGIIGPAVYQEDFDNPAAAGVHIVIFPDGSRVEYDENATELRVDVGAGSVSINCATATVAADTVTIDATQTQITGDLTVGGNAAFNGGSVTHSGTNIGKSHAHSGVPAGAATTGAAV